MLPSHKNIILFDGFCNLCNGAVVFVLKRDKKGCCSFASLQSETGNELISQFGLLPNQNESFLFIENNNIYTKSTATLRVARKLSGLWPALYAFIVIPKFIRDSVYDFIARRRYKLFGKSETCAVPLPEWKGRFLEGNS